MRNSNEATTTLSEEELKAAFSYAFKLKQKLIDHGPASLVGKELFLIREFEAIGNNAKDKSLLEQNNLVFLSRVDPAFNGILSFKNETLKENFLKTWKKSSEKNFEKFAKSYILQKIEKGNLNDIFVWKKTESELRMALFESIYEIQPKAGVFTYPIEFAKLENIFNLKIGELKTYDRQLEKLLKREANEEKLKKLFKLPAIKVDIDFNNKKIVVVDFKVIKVD